MSRSASLAKLSVSNLDREIQRRQRGGKSLLRKRARFIRKLEALDAQIAALGIDGA